MIDEKNDDALRSMDRANTIVRTVLSELAAMARPGVTTRDLDRHAAARLKEEGARSAFKGYRLAGAPDYPAVLCVSLNEEVVHGIPSPKRVLRDGDVLSLDFGAVVEGYYGDAAVTVAVGRVTDEATDLIRTTRDALLGAIGAMRPGNRISDISAAVQTLVEGKGYSVIRDFVGHGIGRKLHEEPQVPNYVAINMPDPRLRKGMVLAIEPMVAAGRAEVELDPRDGWTVRTADRSLAAHWELSVAVTESGPWVLGGPVDAPGMWTAA